MAERTKKNSTTTTVRVKKAKKTGKSSGKQTVRRRLALRAPKWLKRVKWPKWLRAIGGYFVGSWKELRQVRWPNRKATWSLTVAVIIFSLFFAGIILTLDFIFNYLFKEVLL